MLKIFKFFKDVLLFIPATLLLAPFSSFFHFITYFNKLLLWIYKHKNEFLWSDYFSPFRDYAKREKLYEFVANHFKVPSEQVTYMEFGVASGASFRWWLNKNTNPQSTFFGFDTFEGLPEDWGGFYNKGDMSHNVPSVNDTRAVFVKGLFQDTLSGFIQQHHNLLQLPQKKIIHMDADLYSATIFTLSQLYPYLRKGDIIMFDEFNVALHEFKAYLEFTGNFYITLKPVAAVNNFYQAAFEVA